MNIKFINECYKYKNFIKKYDKNDVIFYEGEICKYLCIILSGQVSIVSYSFNGKEILFKNLNKNDMFSQTLLFSSSYFYKGNVIAKSDCERLFIDENNLLKVLENKELLQSFLRKMSDEILIEKEKCRMLSFLNIQDRVLYLLSNHQKITYTSITLLASKLFVSREALSRTLKTMVNNNIIEIKDKCIKLK